MTAEEYINNVDVKPFHYADRFCANHNIKSFAYKASEMARKEEREKAIKVFREMTCKMGIDIPCERCSSTCAIYKFKELLDKE